MRRTTLSLTTLFLAIILLQISTPYGFASLLPESYSPVVAAASTEPMPVDTFTMLTFNSTYSSQTYSMIVSEPTQFSFNMSLHVDSAPPGPFTSVYFDVYLRGSASQYIPHLNQFIDGMDTFWDDSWWWMTTGYTDTSYTEFLSIQPGLLVLEFDFELDEPTDQLSLNFTLSQLFSLDSASEYSWDEVISTTWTDDNSWAGSRFTIPEANLYNISLYAEMDYTTTASWGGNPFFQPFMGISLIDSTYGANAPQATYHPSFAIPGGAGSSTANWTYSGLYKLLPENYYLFGEIGGFEFLNGSSISLEMTIDPVVQSILEINQSIELSFDSTLTTNVAYVGIHAPQMYTYGLYFDDRIGANWSIECYDIDTGWMPPSFGYYNDASSYTQIEDRFENGFSFCQPMMGSTPTSSLTGEEYFEMYMLGGTDVYYINDSAQMAIVGSNWYQNAIDTFYLQIVANPFSGIPTAVFNITLNFEAYPIPTLESITTFAVNQTIGPFYKAFALPVISGLEYDITAWASDYNSSGVAGIFMAPVPNFYLDWQWSGYVPLYQTTPSGGVPFQVTNINDTAGIKFIAARTTTLYLGVMGISMSGPPPSDTTEITVNSTATIPTSYALGTVVTENLQDMEMKTYSVNLAAGTSYRLSMSLDATGNYALCSVFDSLGYTPFDATLYTLWLEVYSGYLNASFNYQALTSGPVTIVLIADGIVHFSLLAIGEAPGSFVLGLMIGLIFMIAGVIIVYAIMRRRF